MLHSSSSKEALYSYFRPRGSDFHTPSRVITHDWQSCGSCRRDGLRIGPLGSEGGISDVSSKQPMGDSILELSDGFNAIDAHRSLRFVQMASLS